MENGVAYYLGIILLTMISLPTFANEVMCGSSYENLTTAPSAIKLAIKDGATGKVMNVVLRNDDYFSYVQQDKRIDDREQYIKFMRDHIGKQHIVDLAKLQEMLGKRWSVRDWKDGSFFKQHVVYDKAMTLESLQVKDKDGLVAMYFEFRDGVSFLKKEYYERFNQKPAFIALLIEFGFDVSWGDIAPILTIRVCDKTLKGQ
jgi:hypothetical protein